MADSAKPTQVHKWAAQPARGWRSYAKRIMIDIVIGYAIICLCVFFMQKRLVYQPSQEKTLEPQTYGFAASQAAELTARTSDGVTLHGWHIASTRSGGKSADLANAALVDLFFCGNAGHRGDRGPTFRRTSSMGADAVCFDYRGYGDSEGSPDEEGLAKDARAAWEYVRSKGVPPQSIVIHGESLGGGVAVRLATELCAEKTPPAGLILEATFPRLAAVAANHYFFLPVSLLLTQRFPSISRIPALTCPLLQLHGARDSLIPIALGRKLFDAAPAQSASGIPKQFVELPACEHNDVGTLNAQEYRQAVRDFYQQLCPDLQAPSPHETKESDPNKVPHRRQVRPEHGAEERK